MQNHFKSEPTVRDKNQQNDANAAIENTATADSKSAHAYGA